MGQKVNPVALRIGIIKSWDSQWYMRKKDYVDTLHEDLIIRRHISEKLKNAEIGKVEIVRYPERVTVNIHTSRPGIVIGAKGKDVDKLKSELQKISGKKLLLNIVEVKTPELTAKLIGENIARQVKNRVSYKRAMKQAISMAIKAGAKGVKIRVSGRLGGAEMSRSEWYSEGRIPLQTLRADIDFAISEALTTFGLIGVKVWVFKGLIYSNRERDDQKQETERSQQTKRRKRNQG